MPVRVLRLKLTMTSVCEKTREGTLSFSSDPEVSDKPHLRTRHVCLIVIGFAVKRILIAIFCCICVFGYLHGWRKEAFASYYGLRMTPEICPQFNALTPQKNAVLWDSLSVNISSPEFKTRAIDWLSGAVRIPTETYDGMDPVGVDPRWEAFAPFHDYILSAFPLAHETLTLNKVNTYGLHFEWRGSDPTLQPLLLTGHQDVVPVDSKTADKWKYPPYSGHFDGERIWGRGSLDDKAGLIGILSTVETLIASGFKPTRTIALAFGFDEEAFGRYGAASLGLHLERAYGENGIAMIVDEGTGFAEQFGSVFATPGIAERGFLNTHVKVTAPGGHSSVPPTHTSIGILAALLVELESNPTKVDITRHEPMYDALQCLAEHAKSIPSHLRKIIKQSTRSDKALHHLQNFIRSDRLLSNLIRTTQAIDVVGGGVKSNALPEQAWAIVNHRIAVVSSLNETKARDTKLLKSLAKKFNLTYEAFGTTISEEGGPSSGTLTLRDSDNTGLEPAPVTPTGAGADAAPYHLLSGTIKATYDAHRSIQTDTASIIVAPWMITGNTDTRYYWKLSRHIFRYNHYNSGQDSGNGVGTKHTINEGIKIDAFLEMIRFFTTLILNADESRTL